MKVFIIVCGLDEFLVVVLLGVFGGSDTCILRGKCLLGLEGM